MSYKLFLDDIRSPQDVLNYINNKIYKKTDWIVVRSYNTFVYIINQKGLPDVVSFDHDLADIHYRHQSDIPYEDMEEKTGYHCAKWMINYCLDNNLNLPKKILIHSMNIVGSQNIISLFETFNKIYIKPKP